MDDAREPARHRGEGVGRRLTRRRLMFGAALLPAALAAGATTRRVTGGGTWLRPRARGTSADVCGACGSPTHHMLAVGCPARGEVRW